jgi:hypothetical protein
LAGALGVLMASVAGGAIDWDTALLLAWVLAAALGLAALWAVVLSDGGPGLHPGTRLVLALGLLLGMVAAARWLWVMGTGAHSYEAATWAVWLVFLGGPFLVASLRLPQLLSWHRDKPA